MPVTNPTPPPAIAFSKNELDLVLQSDDYLAAAAVKSIDFLQFTGAVVADTTFIISWAKGSATMVAKVSPDHSGRQFPTGDGSNSYVTSLLPYFRKNFFINRDYVLSTNFGGTYPKIVFTAIKNGPDYDLNNTNGGASGITTGGVTDQPVANFAHHLELWVEKADGSAFEQAFTANIPLDFPVDGKSTADIHEALHAWLESDYPELGTLYSFCIQSKRRWYFKYAQFFGADPSIQEVITSGFFHIAKGGLGKLASRDRDIISELVPLAGHPEKNRFMRQGSVNKLVRTDQPEWLTWINLSGADKTVVLAVSIVFTDGTSFDFNTATGFSVAQYKKVQFRCGYTELDIATRSGTNAAVYYLAQLKDSDSNPLSAEYGFVIDYNYQPWPRYFVYENSYGAFQTVATTGKGLNEFDRTKEDAQMAKGPALAAIDGELLETNIRIQEKGTVSVGYDRAGKRNTALLRDMAVSHKIYLWQSGKLVPVGLNTQNLKDAADGVYLYANAIEYFPLYPEEVYTEDLPNAEDDTIADILGESGIAVPVGTVGGDGGGGGDGTGGAIIVEFGDTHLSIVAGAQVYTAPILVGKTNYRIYSTQLGLYFRTEDITYNTVAGSFTINVDGFELADGEQLIILPFVLNPDA